MTMPIVSRGKGKLEPLLTIFQYCDWQFLQQTTYKQSIMAILRKGEKWCRGGFP